MKKLLFLGILSLGAPFLSAQGVKSVEIDQLKVTGVNGTIKTPYELPLVSYQVGAKSYRSNQVNPQVSITVSAIEQTDKGLKTTITFANTSNDTLWLHNVVPFGVSDKHIYITGLGDHGLSRTHVFRPGFFPANCIVPDNAWELGYSGVEFTPQVKLFGLARRTAWDKEKAKRRRFETILYPQGTVSYTVWFDSYQGNWQNGLKRAFQERYLYDIDGAFDETLFNRPDLKWIRHSYAMHLVMAWDHIYYDHKTGKYGFGDHLDRINEILGGEEVIALWPNWPMLGIDKRNQWDLFRTLPGGTDKIRQIAELCRSKGSRFFISYNPWDESTRNEDHHAGMADMIGATSADGVVLDTEGASSEAHQNAADSKRPGVIMYSEGMAVPKDMQGIVSGRVHNALYKAPLLNLNKFIKPEFAIFRVAEVGRERIQREYAVSLFNGYGTEINYFCPGRPEWEDEQYHYFARTLMILRQNTYNFTAKDMIPLIDTRVDSIWVNQWVLPHKELFTVLSFVPQGYRGPLFRAQDRPGWHYADLWNFENVEIQDGYVVADVAAFSAKKIGSNDEGEVGAIALFPELITATLENNDVLTFQSSKGTKIRVWKGEPRYAKKEAYKDYPIERQTISLIEELGRFEGKYVVQLFDKDELIDQLVFKTSPAAPRLISKPEKAVIKGKKTPAGMVKIPAGQLKMSSKFGDNFVPTPDFKGKVMSFPTFYMDIHPITNAQFEQFLQATQYRPADTDNFLKHWVGGKIPAGQQNFPVVYVSLEDAKAYAAWAGKRLPTEAEWQYAAQTPKGYEWPWGDKIKVERKTEWITNTLTVSKLKIDSTYCNVGTGQPYAVGKYKNGANPFGLQDLVGCVWQMTNDQYDNGTYYFFTLKGGSYWLPQSSWWYVEGGPRELNYAQKQLRVSPGFERSETVGFRCVADVE